MHDEPVFGSKVKQEPPSRTSRRAWPRLLVFAFLAVLMLVALGGTSRASELDPNETATDALDPIVGTVSDTADPVVETVTDTADPVVESVIDTADPVIGTVTDTIDPVVDTVVPPTKGIIGTGGADPLDPPPRLPVPGVGVPDPGSVGGPDGAGDDGRSSYDRHPAAGGDLP